MQFMLQHIFNTRRQWLCFGLLLFAISFTELAVTSGSLQGQTIWHEDFESYGPGESLHGQNGWNLWLYYHPDDPSTPNAEIVAGAGIDSSQALALWHTESFRSDNSQLYRVFPEPLTGIFWIRARFKIPTELTGELYFNPFFSWVGAWPLLEQNTLGALASWNYSYWPNYTRYQIPLKTDHWYTLTIRIDRDQDTYSAWIDDQVLGQGLPLIRRHAENDFYIGGGGTQTNPLFIDNLVITRQAPADLYDQPLLPEPKAELLFRFAGLADPQLGFSGYNLDIERYGMAIKRINQSGVAFTVILGDAVHEKDDENAYKDFINTTQEFEQPWYPVRGNHDRTDFYQQYIWDELNYAFEYDGFRFIMIDAVGPDGSDGLAPVQLTWIEDQLQQAQVAGQEVIMGSHVSAWDDNARGVDIRFQIGSGKEELKALLDQYDVLMTLSGHYHRGLWHHEENGTHFLVLPAPSTTRFGSSGHVVFDVYSDRIEVYQKPLFFAYEDEKVTEFYHYPYRAWASYSELPSDWTYAVQRPLVIERNRKPVSVAQTGGKREPTSFALMQNYPNPFNAGTMISYELPKQVHVSLTIYDVLGREVAVLVNEQQAPGAYLIQFDAGGLTSGVYLYSLKAGSFADTKKLELLK